MTGKLTNLFICFAVLASMSPAFAEDWSIEADFSESCSCNPACPCMFGSPPTNEYCKGSRLVEIHEGSYGDVDLSGVKVMATFSMGKWVKYYVDAPEDKIEAARDLVAATFPSLAAWGEVLTERADVTVERTDDNITFSVPAAVVEIEVMKGKNGEPIRVENLTGVDNYTQYRSVRNSHAHDRDGFEYSGTNGFTGTVKAEGSTD